VIAHAPARPRPTAGTSSPNGLPARARSSALRLVFLGALGAGGALSLAAAGSPHELSAQSEHLQVLLRGASGFAALAATQLLLYRFLDRRTTEDGVLILAFAAFAVAGIGGLASPASIIDPPGRSLLEVATLVGAALLARAAFWTTPLSARGIVGSVAIPAAVVAIAFLGLAQPGGAAFFFFAALGFTFRAGRGDDAMSAGIAGASILAMFACFDGLLLGQSGRVAAAELAFASTLLLLGDATIGVRRAWQDRAMADARRTVARKLHDGLAQELALLVLQSRSASKPADDQPAFGDIADSSRRALDETRHVIATLTRQPGLTLPQALEREAEEVALRVGLRLELEVGQLDLPDDAEDALLLIAREGLAFAALDCGARSAEVTLAYEGETRLRISHDGAGHEEIGRSGALASIERRARKVGGTLRIAASPRGGLIEVSLP
jgi:signal transduction histidine kinase